MVGVDVIVMALGLFVTEQVEHARRFQCSESDIGTHGVLLYRHVVVVYVLGLT